MVTETQKQLLLEYLFRLEDYKTGRSAVYVNLSLLQQQNRCIQNSRFAADRFSRLIKLRKGQLFIIGNFDLFFVYKSEFHDEVEATLVKIFYQYSEGISPDPTNYNSSRKFLTYFNVEQDFARMLHFLRDISETLKPEN